MRPPYLTIPIQQANHREIERLLRRKLPEVGAFEIWIDHLDPADHHPDQIEELARRWTTLTNKKLAFVCKDPVEKGRYRGTSTQKRDLLLAASRGGAHYIDIGLQNGQQVIRQLADSKRSFTKLICSHHDFEQTPSEKALHQLLRRLRKAGPEVVKLATMVHTPEDNERLIQLALELKQARQRHIILGMGQQGLMTRVFSKPMGNELNFVALEQSTAPGQVSLKDMLSFYQVFGY